MGINSFLQQKEYMETHEAVNDRGDAALTAKKIDLNDWLFQAQYLQDRFGGWSGYPESIQDLAPIQ